MSVTIKQRCDVCGDDRVLESAGDLAKSEGGWRIVPVDVSRSSDHPFQPALCPKCLRLVEDMIRERKEWCDSKFVTSEKDGKKLRIAMEAARARGCSEDRFCWPNCVDSELAHFDPDRRNPRIHVHYRVNLTFRERINGGRLFHNEETQERLFVPDTVNLGSDLDFADEFAIAIEDRHHED